MSSITFAQSTSSFGSSEPVKGPSIDQLEKGQKKIVKLMEKSQSVYLKTHHAAQMLKSSLLDLSENTLSLGKTQASYSGLMQKLNTSLIHLLQRLSEQSFTLTKKMEHRIESLVPNLRKMKQRYSTCAETFSHYKQKVQLLSKNVDKQSRTNIKQEELERLKRNKKKLQGAEREYQQAHQRAVKSYYQFNAEGIRDVEVDFASLISIFASDAIIVSHEWMRHLTEEYNVQIGSKKLEIKTENYNDFQNSSKSKKSIILQDITLKKKRQFFDRLIQQKQLANYLKKIIQKESSLIQKSKPIIQLFPYKKEQIVAFQLFQNIFNNPRFTQEKQDEELYEQREEIIEISQEIKNENEVCEELQIQQPTEISQVYEQNIQRQENESDNMQLQELSSQKQDHIRKQNLEKFDRICEQLPKSRKGLLDTHMQGAFSPSKKAIQTYKKIKIEQNTVFKSPDQFFNVKNFQKQVEPNSLKPNHQAKTSQFQNNLLCFNTLNPTAYKNYHSISPISSNPTLITQSHSLKQSQKKKEYALGFDSFDILMKQKISSEHLQKKQERSHKMTDNLLKL